MKSKKPVAAYLTVWFSLVFAFGIYFVKEYNFVFLTLLLLNFAVAVFVAKRANLALSIICRSLLGALFMFSGFVKGVDPLGTQYVIHDYLQAYNLAFLDSFSLVLAFLLNAVEFTIGFLLFFNIRIKITAVLCSLMMLFFTASTLYDAIANPVPECGCFGKAVSLTNWQTFYKNIVIDTVLVVFLFSLPNIKKQFCPLVQNILLLFAILLSLGFEAYCYLHLPLANFLDWKKGSKMVVDNPLPLKYYSTYKNKTTGEEKEYLTSQIPYTDTTWVKEWEFASSRIEDPNPRYTDLAIVQKLSAEDMGVEVTRSVLSRKNYNFIVVAYNLEKASQKALDRLKQQASKSWNRDISWVLLTSEFVEEEKFENFEVYYSDDTSLKAVIRSNPGILLMKDGVLLDMWAWRDFPNVEEIDFEKYK